MIRYYNYTIMKKFSIEFKWAAIATLAALLWMFLEKALGYHDEKIRYEMGFAMLFNLLTFVFYWLALKQKKREFYNNDITWLKAFMSGLVLLVMISFFYPIVQYIAYNQLSPHFFELLQQALVSGGRTTVEEAEKYSNFDWVMRNAVVNNLSFGVVYAAIVSYFIQTKPGKNTNDKLNKPEMVKVKKNKNTSKNKKR